MKDTKDGRRARTRFWSHCCQRAQRVVCAVMIGMTLTSNWSVAPQTTGPAPETVVAILETRGEVFATAENELRFEKLPDGSLVKMVPSTRLQFDFSGPERRISLNRGQAEFTVAKDRSRPFIVQTELVNVVAVGTIFAVRADICGGMVDVSEGVVEVHGRGTATNFGRTMRAGAHLDLSSRCTKASKPSSNSATTGK